MNDDNNKEVIIDLSQLFGAVKKSIVSIIIWGIAGLLVSLFATFVLMTPKYGSTIDILVNQKADNTQMQYTAQQADLQAINTYMDVLKKSVILAPVVKEVRERDNYQGSVGTLQKSMTITNQTNSQVLSVTVTDTNAYTAADIANTIGKVFAKKIKTMMKIDNVTVVTKATVNTNPVSPRKMVNSVLGLIIGIIIGVAIAVIKELCDTTVKDTDFLTKELGLTNLGAIYHIRSDNQDYGLVKIIEKNESIPENGDEHRVRRRV
ncbi:YveK family protein [Ligilactobacillus ruminis]|uniref:YveK family protein n=1 Tax=Ligilactobacillus ruminis TaxID=1623 RepID=UPI00265AEF7C|nr:Wzz/FepE/Etk N-terminal domain-containing protein [Ligilactobacillus ruminis]WKB70674.1 Wzz/FepE/Etk N-terminal domain-containing protein [Ligilactobacillus ruminis]